MSALAAVAAVLGGMAFVLAPAAVAQTNYPGGNCTATTSSQSAGSHQIGETFTIHMSPTCVFDVGVNASISVNGLGIGTKAVDASGGVTVTVRIASSSTLEINDPITVAGQCGVNSVTATAASSAAGANVTHTATFTVACPTGVAQPAQAVPGRVAFTGANVLRWSAIALSLVAIGALLIVSARRRSRARA